MLAGYQKHPFLPEHDPGSNTFLRTKRQLYQRPNTLGKRTLGKVICITFLKTIKGSSGRRILRGWNYQDRKIPIFLYTVQSVIMCYKMLNMKFHHSYGKELPQIL